MQFRENLADRQAAEAVRARIDWKYLLSLELTDPGFDFSALSEFRDRLLTGSAEALLLDKLLERCQGLGLLKARGSNAPTPPMCSRRSVSSTASNSSPRRCERPSMIWPRWPPTGCETWRPWSGMSGMATDRGYAAAPGEGSPRGLCPDRGRGWLPPPGRSGGRDARGPAREAPSIATLRQTWQRHYERSTGARRPRQGHAAVTPRAL